jgi:hypothetical protein
MEYQALLVDAGIVIVLILQEYISSKQAKKIKELEAKLK